MKFRHVTDFRPLLAAIQREVISPMLKGGLQTVDTVELSLPEGQALAMELGVQQLPNNLTLPYSVDDEKEVREASVKLKVMMPDEMHIDDFEGEVIDVEDSTTA